MGKGHGKSSGFIHPNTNVLLFWFFLQTVYINDKNIYVHVYKVTPPAKAQATHHSITAKKKIRKKRKESLSSQSDITQ